MFEGWAENLSYMVLCRCVMGEEFFFSSGYIHQLDFHVTYVFFGRC